MDLLLRPYHIHFVLNFSMLLSMCTLGDTWRYEIQTSAWSEISTSGSPSPRYGFVGGLVENFWIVSHGESMHEYGSIYNVVYVPFFTHACTANQLIILLSYIVCV